MANEDKVAGGARGETDFSNCRFVEFPPSDQYQYQKMKKLIDASAGFDGTTTTYPGVFGMPFVEDTMLRGEPYTWVHHHMQSPLKQEPSDQLPRTTEDIIRFPNFPPDQNMDSKLDVAMADIGDEDAVATSSKPVQKGKARRFAGKNSGNNHPRAKSMSRSTARQILKTGKAIVKEETTMVKDETSMVKDETSMVKDETSMINDETATVKNEAAAMPNSTEMKSFRIGDTAKVVQFLKDTFGLLQQQVGKKMAKSWVKDICPKKQAKFPYSDKNRWEGLGLSPEVPKWWPEGCPFREPDHLSKPHRLVLVVHLLRLRPDPAKLQEWNKNQAEQNYIHKTVGWTAFLKKATPMSLFVGLGPERGEERREWLLQRLYAVAEMEEDYQSGARDGDDLYTYPAEVEECEAQAEKQKAKKRTTKRAKVSSHDEAPVLAKPASRKRAKKAARQQTYSPTTDESSTLPSRHQTPIQQQQATERDATVKCDQSLQMEFKPLIHNGVAFQEYPNQRQVDPQMRMPAAATARYAAGLDGYAVNYQPGTDLHVDSPLNTSFGSVSSGAESLHSQFEGLTPRALAGYPNIPVGHVVPRRKTVHVQCARDVPIPEFDTNPNTPTLSPMANMQLDPYRQASGQQSAFDCMLAEQERSITRKRVRQQYLSQHSIAHHPEHTTLSGDCLAAHPAMAVPAEYQSFPSTFDHYRSTISDPPTYYYQHQQSFPDHQGPPLVYADPKIGKDFPTAPQPGDILRGYTGHSSGVGDGAWV